jgi:iron complex outermembrane receptor protein
VAGEPFEAGTFPNDSRPAQLLGIPKLRPEKSRNISAGFTGTVGKFKVTLDGYFIRINDRIVYTDLFQGNSSPTAPVADQELFRLLAMANANRAAFFANAINTETRGIDLVVSYGQRIGGGNFRADLTGNVTETRKVGAVQASEKLAGKEAVYFSESSRIYLEGAVPRQKVGLTLTYGIGKVNFFLRNMWFGKVQEASNIVAQQEVYGSKVITDLSIGYKVATGVRLSVGSNNIFDVYPDETKDVATRSSNQFIYSRRATQFGYNGRYVFGRIEFSF